METARKIHLYRLLIMVFMGCLVSGAVDSLAHGTGVSLSKGQMVYVPVYSHIYIGDRERPFLLAVTLSIRNTDQNDTIVVNKIDYYNSEGVLLNSYLKAPLVLEKMSAARFVVKESDKSGGSGASFIVEWESGATVSAPVIETVMIGAQTQQGISFTSPGRVLQEK